MLQEHATDSTQSAMPSTLSYVDYLIMLVRHLCMMLVCIAPCIHAYDSKNYEPILFWAVRYGKRSCIAEMQLSCSSKKECKK